MTEKSLDERFSKHSEGNSYNNQLVCRFIKKYGKNNITVEVLEEVDGDKEKLREVEKRYIRERQYDEMCLNQQHAFFKAKKNILRD